MLDEKDLQAIAELVDKIVEPIRNQLTKVCVTLENDIQPKINTLAEGHEVILDRLVPRSRVDELEEEVKFLKIVIRQMNEDLQSLKKAQ